MGVKFYSLFLRDKTNGTLKAIRTKEEKDRYDLRGTKYKVQSESQVRLIRQQYNVWMGLVA